MKIQRFIPAFLSVWAGLMLLGLPAHASEDQEKNNSVFEEKLEIVPLVPVSRKAGSFASKKMALATRTAVKTHFGQLGDIMREVTEKLQQKIDRELQAELEKRLSQQLGD